MASHIMKLDTIYFDYILSGKKLEYLTKKDSNIN